MSEFQSDILDQYVTDLSARYGRIRVWSLVVTIFGDAIAPRGGEFRLGALQLITKRIGIESNALRTAMSRLASDGWLERNRVGRASYYSQSKMAERENSNATKLIYDLSPPNCSDHWSFILSTKKDGYSPEDRQTLHECGFAFYGRKLAVTPSVRPEVSIPKCINEISVFSAQSIDQSTIQKMISNLEFVVDCSPQYDDFVSSASILHENLDSQSAIDPLDAIALRSLLIHSWRRIVLRDVYWPGKARSENWPGHKARILVAKLYRKLLPQSEYWLDTIESIPVGKLPAPSEELSRRLTI